MTDRKRATLRLPLDCTRRLDEAARVSGLSRNRVVQLAIDGYLDGIANPSVNSLRIAQASEYLLVVADLAITKLIPDQRENITAIFAQRLEQYHGVR